MSAVLDPSTALPQAAAMDLVTQPHESGVMPGFINESSWKLANRIAQAYAASSIVPEAYRGNVANCIIALEMANRMGASPVMVMQNLYVVHGNPSWSAKFLIATFNQCGRFTALRYEWNEARTACRAWSTEKATGERLDGPLVSVDMARAEGWSSKKGTKWASMPELMLMYRAATFFVRAYAPELSMGLQTTDEIEDVTPEPQNRGLSAVRAAIDVSTLPETPAPEGATAAPPPTLAQAIEDMEQATDADLAQLVVDNAAAYLDATDLEELKTAYSRAWT